MHGKHNSYNIHHLIKDLKYTSGSAKSSLHIQCLEYIHQWATNTKDTSLENQKFHSGPHMQLSIF